MFAPSGCGVNLFGKYNSFQAVDVVPVLGDDIADVFGALAGVNVHLVSVFYAVVLAEFRAGVLLDHDGIAVLVACHVFVAEF